MIVLVLSLCLCSCGEKNSKPELEKSDELSDITYSLGDTIRDFSVTAIDGTKYQISDILNEKKAVVLNFWFINCMPCRMEFPFMQKAYEEYSQDIEILAINPVDEKENKISDFSTELNLSIPMIKGDREWTNAMKISGFPTTVVIDQNGIISMFHTGSITEEGVFEKIFEHFTRDDYESGVINSISDIK